MKIAVVGATGMVGTVMLDLLAKRHFPVTELIPVASEKSVGKTIVFNGQSHTICSMEDAISRRPDIALFSAGGDTSREWAPRFAEAGTVVIDNSSAWRMDPTKKLVIPEVNGHTLTSEDRIIANPNCSTIQMVVALAPLHKSFEIERLIISTYQSITGTGKKAVDQLENERNGKEGPMAYPYAIDKNCLPHCDVFLENDYTKEEMKLVNETRKILGDDSIGVTATAVRVPVVGGHSESINISFKKPADVSSIRGLLQDTEGVILQDNPVTNTYPMPIFSEGKDEVFVGRIRKDESHDNAFNMWIVADNLRKGAATNAIQIAELLIKD